MSAPSYNRAIRSELLALTKGNAARAREALAFIEADDATAEDRFVIVSINPMPMYGPEDWEDALRFLEGRDA